MFVDSFPIEEVWHEFRLWNYGRRWLQVFSLGISDEPLCVVFRMVRFCQFCRNALAATGPTAEIPSQGSILRSARRNGWRRRSSQRKRVISTCCPPLASRVPRAGFGPHS